ncbi:MAG TPA: arsenate reductase ArsC [Chloroflexota bacterium]|nr:arsenate reductase ArsC [Chloroflexota bacterium]
MLFLCVHNSARSQMAEGLLRQLGGDRFEAHSAGAEPAARVNPLAVAVMAERGIDIAGQRPKLQSAYAHQRWDYVVTTCDEAREACPVFPGAPNQLHWRFDDPSAAEGNEEERRRVFQRVADEIEASVRAFVAGEGRDLTVR